MTETIFEKIIAKEIPAKVVYEDENILAFHDIDPKAPIHVLVIPKAKVERFSKIQDQNAEFITSYFQGISKVASLLDLDSDGYRVVFNNGNNGGQEVEYIHAHILGGRAMQWPPG